MSSKTLIAATHYPQSCAGGLKLLQSEGFEIAARYLIGAAVFAHKKDGALLVNTARGPIVDERAALAGREPWNRVV